MKTSFIVYLRILLILMSIPTAFAAKIQVAVDRNPVTINDAFQIIFTAPQSSDDDPDFSPLERDFTVLNRSQSTSYSSINGKSSSTHQWTLDVMAKNVGNVQIPAIHFGNDNSDPLSITVNQANTASVDNNDELFLQVEATPETVYVQSQVLYTLRFYRRVDITGAKLNEPELADALIENLGNDSTYNTQINGVAYEVTERKYAIFPQKSGKLTIKPLELVAEVIKVNPRLGFFGQQTHNKRILSKEITLNVQPVPPTFTGKHWLTAEQLDFEEQWSGDKNQIKVGEPLTRTLRLTAKGATVGSLPELNNAQTDSALKSYADQPLLKEDKSLTGITALREEKIALIPAKAGTYTLPALEIPWFNTQTQRIEIAKIPETTLTAIAANDAPHVAAPPAPTKSDNTTKTQPVQTPAIASASENSSLVWQGLALFFALGWLSTLIYFLRQRPKPAPIADDDSAVKLSQHSNALKKACTDNDPHAAKIALLAWGQQQFNVTSLGALADLVNARLRDEILQLNEVLYGKHAESWQGKKLFQAFTENKARAKLATPADKSLEPLYRL